MAANDAISDGLLPVRRVFAAWLTLRLVSQADATAATAVDPRWPATDLLVDLKRMWLAQYGGPRLGAVPVVSLAWLVRAAVIVAAAAHAEAAASSPSSSSSSMPPTPCAARLVRLVDALAAAADCVVHEQVQAMRRAVRAGGSAAAAGGGGATDAVPAHAPPAKRSRRGDGPASGSGAARGSRGAMAAPADAEWCAADNAVVAGAVAGKKRRRVEAAGLPPTAPAVPPPRPLALRQIAACLAPVHAAALAATQAVGAWWVVGAVPMPHLRRLARRLGECVQPPLAAAVAAVACDCATPLDLPELNMLCGLAVAQPVASTPTRPAWAVHAAGAAAPREIAVVGASAGVCVCCVCPDDVGIAAALPAPSADAGLAAGAVGAQHDLAAMCGVAEGATAAACGDGGGDAAAAVAAELAAGLRRCCALVRLARLLPAET